MVLLFFLVDYVIMLLPFNLGYLCFLCKTSCFFVIQILDENVLRVLDQPAASPFDLLVSNGTHPDVPGVDL